MVWDPQTGTLRERHGKPTLKSDAYWEADHAPSPERSQALLEELSQSVLGELLPQLQGDDSGEVAPPPPPATEPPATEPEVPRTHVASRRHHEVVIQERATDKIVARLAVDCGLLVQHPTLNIWAAAAGNHLYLFQLEGPESHPDSKSG